MLTRRTIPWKLVARFSWRLLLIATGWSTIAVALFLHLRTMEIDCSLPMSPLATIGIAVAFYVGFKNSQSYDRMWEARKVWGGIVNVSRSWAVQVLAFVSKDDANEHETEAQVLEVQRQLVYRQLAWINALRFQLRRKLPWSFSPDASVRKYQQDLDEEAEKACCGQFLPDAEQKEIWSQTNHAVQILRLQGIQLKKLAQRRMIDEFRLISLMDLTTEMSTLQGKSERIKNTPFPRQYAFFSLVFTWLFILLLPFGLVGEMAARGPWLVWLTVPITVLIAWIFWTMESVGDSSEDPFENFINDVPLTAICRSIEIDLRQMLGETDTPPPLKPVNDILM